MHRYYQVLPDSGCNVNTSTMTKVAMSQLPMNQSQKLHGTNEEVGLYH